MKPVDLTPRTYITRGRAHFALRCWALAAGLCAIAAALPISIESTRRGDHTAELAREQIEQAQLRQQQNKASATAVSSRLTQAHRELQAQAHLTQRPDWSDLIARVAAQFDGQVMVGFRLGPLSDPKVREGVGPTAASAPADSVWLILGGVAQTNSEVPGLILRLESLGLFERVVMTKTERTSFAGGPRTGFVLACRVQ